MSDIVERLRAVESSEVCETTRTTTNWYRNPDGPEAADEITRLRAENERLRGVVKAAYREGYLDAHEGSARFEAESEAEAYWRLSDAAAALQETGDE